jgi:4-alpha-glucanotransferase
MDNDRHSSMPRPPVEVDEALGLLDKRSLVLAIHDQSFPSAPGEDTGRGTPYSEGGMRLVRFARMLGFNGIQLGPQGQTSRINPSPYDGSLFSRNFLSIDLRAVAEHSRWAGLMSSVTVRSIVESNPRPEGRRAPYSYVFDAYCSARTEMRERYVEGLQRSDPAVLAIASELVAFRERNAWLRLDALYEALCVEHGHVHWRDWPDIGASARDRVLCCPPASAEEFCAARREDIERRHRAVIEGYELAQLIVHRQHEAFRRAANSWGVKLYGDVQVGMSPRDTWSRQALLLPGYRLGAPPSRTNPEGQPWGHGVLDPDQYQNGSGAPGPVLRFFSERLGKMLAEFDGLRIDHPHGLVCPWVYRADDPDHYHAVQNGARLFASPDLPDHPALARHAIARPEQLRSETETPRYADHWVRCLEPAQVERYAIVLDALIEQARGRGREVDDILCEVLSTQPYPLACVMARPGLGRFRVTQKARVDDPADVYRSENARPEDWIMVGNHDTPPLWCLAKSWQGSGEGEIQASYLAARLCPDGGAGQLARRLAADPRELVHAKFADIFASRARHVMIFFPDLFGMEDVYNVPGTVSEHNWTLRLPPDYGRTYPADAARGNGLNLPYVLAMALCSRGRGFAAEHAGLIARLESLAGWQVADFG